MGGVFFCSQSFMLPSPSFSAFGKTIFGSPKVPLKETTDGPLLLVSTRDLHYPVVSCKQADGDRKGASSQSSGHGRTPKGDENKVKQSSKNPEEIISLFRKIQSSISEGSVSSKKKSSKISETGNVPSAESILEVLHQSRAKVKAARKEGDKISVRQKSSLRKEKKANNLFLADTKSVRPPSNFVRRSPIPPSIQGLKSVNLGSEELTPTTNDDGNMKSPELKEDALKRFEALKLQELKEVAKSRGIKGYSKLRKAELVKLLVML